MTGSMAKAGRKRDDPIAARAAAMAGGAKAGNAMDTGADAAAEEEIAAIVADADGDPAGAIGRLETIVAGEMAEPVSPAQVRQKELAIQKLAELYRKHEKTAELTGLIRTVQPLMVHLSKAKCGKLFRHLLAQLTKIESAAVEEQIEVVVECIEWTKAEKRRFLRQTLEMTLAGLHLKAREYQQVLAVAQPLIRELKRLDDKLQLVEVQLMESRAYYALSNYPRSRAALVSARTTANGVYTPPATQAALDLQSGIMHAQEHDFKTAYSYFYEAFEGFDATSAKKDAISGLKYMILCKIMLEEADDVTGLLASKLALKYTTGTESSALDAMKAVAKANMNRSLEEFAAALGEYKDELGADVIIQSHVDDMNDTMLQNNLCRIVEPYSSIEIAHVAKLINLPQAQVEKKLSEMILDRKLAGILDQGAGVLEVFTVEEEDKTYTAAVETITHMGQVVEALYKRAEKLV